MSHKSLRAALLVGIFLALLPAATRAQQTLGSINGTVTDSSGAVVQGAMVKVHNVDTGLEQTATTKNDGSFSIVDLPIGTYSVTLTKGGFKTAVYSQILIQGNRTTTVNATLQPGEVSTSITVTATPLLNQTDTTNGYTLSPDVIRSIPLGTGSFTQLAILAPGVNADVLSGAGTNEGLGNVNIFANGQRDTSNSFTFNSVNSNNLFNGLSSSSISTSRFLLNTNEQFQAGGVVQTNTSVFDAIGQGLPTPPPETIQEVHVNTSMYDASQGANSGAHVEVTTKSGANNIHGETWWYHQTDAWNATPFFFNAAGRLPNGEPVLPKEPLHKNIFGADLGGPIIRNKLFYFASYAGQRTSDGFSGATIVDNVPAGLTDDRSAATLVAVAGLAPGTAVDPAALTIMQAKTPGGQLLVPSQNIFDPNTIGLLAGNAVESGPPSTFNVNQAVGDIDYVFGPKDRLAGKYFFQNNPSVSTFATSQVLGFPQTLQGGSQVFSLDNTTILTPNTTWEQRFGFIRETANATTTQLLTPSGVGINVLGSPFFPGITLNNAGSGTFNPLRIGPANNFANAGAFQNHAEAASNYNWTVGRHTLAFGFNWDYGQLNILNRENEVATFNFSKFANFLTGHFGGRSGGRFLDGETNRYYRARESGLFAQDNFKLRSNLTITAGLRWDWDGPLYEKYGRLTNFNPSQYSYDLATDTINNIGLVVAGNNKQFCATKTSFCTNNSTLTGRQWLFEPRIGLAWSPSFVKNLVIRAGFGLYADRGEFFTELSPSAGLGISGPFGVTTEQPFTVPVANSCFGNGCLSNNPFGTSPLPPPPNNFSGVAALVHPQGGPLGLSGCAEPVTPTCTPTTTPLFAFLFGSYDPRNTLPYSENWTLDTQWQPWNTVVFDVGYVGNHGVHQLLPIPFNQAKIATPLNPVNGQIFSYGLIATDSDFNTTGNTGGLLTEQIQTTIGDFTGVDGNTALRVPFIGYNPNSDFWEATGISNYDALQVSVKKRFSHRFMINASYTWSHTLDEGGGLAEGLFFNGNDPLNPKSAYGNAAFDRTHVFIINYMYQVPDLAKSSAFLKQAVNGWGFQGITVAESGQAYPVYDFSGTVASQFWGSGDDFITNPLLAIPGGSSKSVQLQGTTGINPANPVLNGNAFGVFVNAPGTNGVPPCGPTTDEPTNPTAACDFSETSYQPIGRDLFRGPFQTRFDFAVFKNFKLTERFNLRFDAQFFNLFNHPSFDTPSNNFVLDSCFGPNAQTAPGLVQFGVACSWSGKVVGVPGFTPAPLPFGSGSVTNTLGSPRFIQMALHLTF